MREPKSPRGPARRSLGVAAFLITSVVAVAAHGLQPGDEAPKVTGQRWFNSLPVPREAWRGRVVLVEFWTFGCWNCKNVEPYVKRWHERYAKRGLIVLAVHSPEFDFEKSPKRVEAYLQENGIAYPVCVDNRFKTWKRFHNRYWPTFYLIDKRGIVRHVQIGEGGYDVMERKMKALLAESAPAKAPAPEPAEVSSG